MKQKKNSQSKPGRPKKAQNNQNQPKRKNVQRRRKKIV